MNAPANATVAAVRLAAVPDSVCSCQRCQGMCERRPCWTTPAEAQHLIDAGFGGRLMRDWWCSSPIELADDDEGRWDDTSLLVPAMVGHEGEDCPDGSRFSGPQGRCAFLSAEGRCELHALGLKPSEGRKAIHYPDYENITENIHQLCAATWATPEAQAMVREWQASR